MGFWDWLGPTSLTKRDAVPPYHGAPTPRRGWDALPAVPAERKSAADAEILRTYYAGLSVPPLLVSPTWGPSFGPLGPSGNSAVAACLQVLATAIGEPDVLVFRETPDGRAELDGDPLGALLDRPNPHMTLDTMLGYVSTCLHVDGNAYWRKLRAGDPDDGNVVELWPISPTKIAPWTAPGSGDFVTSYRYARASGHAEEISPSNVVHFRYQLDDADHRLGCAPLKRLLREISSDERATRYADRLLANLAINGLSLTFDKDAPPIDQATADELKARIAAAYGGDNIGSTAVLSPGATLTALGFSPEQLDMKTLHRVPEERISAVLGVPAIVAGLGAGLDHATYSNVEQAREAFTETKLLPLWRQLAATMTLSLVPDFYGENRAGVEIDFDTDAVRALATDQDALAVRLQTLVAAGILTVDEARGELGLEPKAPDAEAAAPTPASAPPSTEARRRPYLVKLPAAETKGVDDVPDALAALRAEAAAEWLVEFERWLRGVERRVVRRLRNGADTASDLVPEIEVEILAEVERPLALAVLGDVVDITAHELGVSFIVDDAATRAYLRSAGANIVGITETTRRAVQDALIEGQQLGEGIDPLARRLRELPAFGPARARTVARTELGTSQNTAAIAAYRSSRVVVGIRVLDGDYDAACQAMNGRTFTLDQAPPALEHPNCVRAFAPLTDAAELGPGGAEAAG